MAASMVKAQDLSIAFLLVLSSVALDACAVGREAEKAAACMECVRIRVGVPLVARGPAPNTVDNYFSAIELPDGRFRGFTAAAHSYAIDGNQPYDMGGPAVTILKPGPPGSQESCGQWLMHVEPLGRTLLGWISNETACDYAKGGQTHSYMSLAKSTDYGLTWNVLGPIITGKAEDRPTPGRMTGEGCPAVIDGKDGYYYAYCGRNRDRLPYIARAPIADPGPGNWKKYFNGAFSEPGLGGDASSLAGSTGGSVSYWSTAAIEVSVGWVPGGMGLAFSQDRLSFTNLPARLMPLDYGNWARPDPHELEAYMSLIDARTGANQLSDHWLMAYLYIQPNESFDKRYLVFRPIEASRSRRRDEPQAAIALAHWYSVKKHEHWSTTAPVPGNYNDYQLIAQSGYLLTATDAQRPTIEIDDCVKQQGTHHDHILMQKKEVCESHGYKRERTVGWVFPAPQQRTQALYRCFSESEGSHFAANREDCRQQGKMEVLLGYDLTE
jgi:hypothetical protein